MSSDSPQRNTLGSRLRERREGLGLSIQDIAREVKISPQYVRALEEGNFDLLGAKVYAYGFLKKMLALFGIEETKNWIEQFDVEWDVWVKKKEKAPLLFGQRKEYAPAVTPRRILWGMGVVLLIVFLVFAGTRIESFIRRPSLIVEEPQDKIEALAPLIAVRGRTEKESRLTVNGREIAVDGSGNFHDSIQLLAGVNELVFMAQNRFGKETKVVRYIVVR